MHLIVLFPMIIMIHIYFFEVECFFLLLNSLHHPILWSLKNVQKPMKTHLIGPCLKVATKRKLATTPNIHQHKWIVKWIYYDIEPWPLTLASQNVGIVNYAHIYTSFDHYCRFLQFTMLILSSIIIIIIVFLTFFVYSFLEKNNKPKVRGIISSRIKTKKPNEVSKSHLRLHKWMGHMAIHEVEFV